MNILNFLPSIFGFVGTILIFFYGIPRKIDYGGLSNLVVNTGNENQKKEEKKIKKYKNRGNIGIILVSIAFLLDFSLKLISFISNQ